MNKEDLYALLGLGIGGLGGYFGQRSLDKRRAGNQLSLEDQERLAKISAGIDPETNLPFGYEKPEEEGPGIVDSTKELVNKAIEAYNESDFKKDFVQQMDNDPRFEASTPDRSLVQALIEEGEDALFGNVDYEDLGKVVPVGNVDEDFYMPAEANKVLTTAGNITPRSTAIEEMAGLSQTPQNDFYIPLGGDGDIYLEGPALESDLMLSGPAVDQRGTELDDNPRISNVIEYLGGDEALTPKGEQFYEDYIADPTDAIKDFFGFGDPEVVIEPTSQGFNEMMDLARTGTAGDFSGVRVSDPEQRALKGLFSDIYMDERYRTLDPYEDPNSIVMPFNQGGRVGLQGGGFDAGVPGGGYGMGVGPDGVGANPSGTGDTSSSLGGKGNSPGPSPNDGAGPKPAPSGVEEAETTPAFDPMVDMSSFYGPMYGEDTDVNANGIPDSQEFGPVGPAPNEMGMTTDLGPLGTGVGFNTPMGTLGIGNELGMGLSTNFADDQGILGMGYNPMSGQVGMSATYGFNQGGRVGLDNGGSLTDDITELMNSLTMNMGDNQQMYQLSDADSFLRAEILGDDNPRYNYTVGSSLDSLMPGLSFEAGVMDDAIYGPGMTSPDDYKFFNLKKTF